MIIYKQNIKLGGFYMGKNNSESWDEIADRLTKSANNYVDELEYITEEANKMNEIMHY